MLGVSGVWKGLASDYAELSKEYKPYGTNVSLWESFLTGAQTAYSNVGQQVSEKYAYDISDAYANYKQQQLQLQMNQQLGAGFKEQVGKQLQTGYESAFEKLKTEEAGALSDIVTDYNKTVSAQEQQFLKLGEMGKKFDKLISEFYTNIPESGVKTYGDLYSIEELDDGTRVKTLTDAGKLLYHDILSGIDTEGNLFTDFWLNEDSVSDFTQEEREELYSAYRQNPELFKYMVSGQTADFDAEAVRERLISESEELKKQQLLENDKGINTAVSDVVNNINFDWDDSVMLFGKQPLAFDSKYVANNVDKLKLHYSQLGINTDYAKEDLTRVMKMMKDWFNDTGTHKASTQKAQYEKYLREVIKDRLNSK
jgi:hypothetical protein